MRIPNILNFIWNRIILFFTNSNVQKTLGILLFFSITILILFSSYSPNQVALHPDEVAQQDIRSEINAIVIDYKQTAVLQNQAAAGVQKVYQEDQYALTNMQNEINRFYNNIIEIKTIGINKQEELQSFINEINIRHEQFEQNYTDQQLARYILLTPDEDLEQIHAASMSLVENIMNKPVTEETLEDAFQRTVTQTNTLSYAPQARDLINIAIINSLRPTLVFNKEATDKAIDEAMRAVEPVQKNIKAGEIIVRAGDRVTPEQISALEQLGIQRTQSYSLTLIGVFLLVILTFLLGIEFIRRYYKEIFNNDRMMILIGLIFVLMLLLTRFMAIIEIDGRTEINALIGYMAPVAAGSMLIAILLDNRLAYFMTMVMAIYVGLINEGNQLFYTIVAFAGGTMGVFQVHRVNQTSDLAKSGLYIALVNIVAILTLLLVSGNVSLDVVFMAIIIGVINGLLSAVLMIGVLPYLETAFSITSMVKLLELTNPNHYLLKRLLLEAPGTYHHSLMVGNLAEASAEAIGANPLLVRVGAYYHDIGKLKRPDYFVENQQGFDNPHEKIAPALSALIITSHVKDGVELAREAHIPEDIIDFIEQHHGTSLAKYFYSRALEEDRDGNISEDNFRYAGPKPQSKEVALVMLADSVEAAIRSLSEPTPAKIKNMVRLIIKDKLNDDQLESSALTFKDLDVIANSFCKILEGIYHRRIEYPEIIIKEFQKRRESHGDHDHQPAEQS